jgi:hypothetical protein
VNTVNNASVPKKLGNFLVSFVISSFSRSTPFLGVHWFGIHLYSTEHKNSLGTKLYTERKNIQPEPETAVERPSYSLGGRKRPKRSNPAADDKDDLLFFTSSLNN